MASTLPKPFNINNHPENHPIISPAELEAVKVVNAATAVFLKARKKTIQLLREVAAETDRLAKHKSNTSIAGRTLSIVGSIVGCVAGGVLIVVTAGAAAVPIAAMVLIGTGAGVGMVGGITRGVGGYICTRKHDAMVEQLRKAIEEDEEARSRLSHLMETFRSTQYDHVEFAVLKAGRKAGSAVTNTVMHVTGGVALVTLLISRLSKLSKHIENTEPGLIILMPSLMMNVEVAATAGVTIANEIVRGPAGVMVEGVAEKGAFHGTRSGVQAAIQVGGDSILRSSVNVAARAGAKEATATLAKSVARASGGLSIGLGAIMIAWDAYGLYGDCRDRMKESIGDAMRRLAKSLEDAYVGSSEPEETPQNSGHS